MNAEIGDNFDWIIDSAGTPSLNTGPLVDHTTGVTTGKFFRLNHLILMVSVFEGKDIRCILMLYEPPYVTSIDQSVNDFTL